MSITLDIYSHVLPGMQEATAEKFDKLFEGDFGENSSGNVSKMLATGPQNESEPWATRMPDTLINNQGVVAV